jgi:serine/threonine-protein kinase ATR
MADGFNFKAAASGAEGLNAGHLNGGGPPPSTLAAQLVENISPTAKSSRSDENSELKGFFAVIQQVKDNPDVLKTPDDRVEHNHMLIYVYSRVVLESIRLDDPSLDRAQSLVEALKAINFLRFTIKETPLVLLYRVKNETYLYRGQEPLWLWLIPQLLRLLGHTQGPDLDRHIEDFLQFLLAIVAHSGALWEIGTSLALYLRSCITSRLSFSAV